MLIIFFKILLIHLLLKNKLKLNIFKYTLLKEFF
mgnify:CR=1 FL=1